MRASIRRSSSSRFGHGHLADFALPCGQSSGPAETASRNPMRAIWGHEPPSRGACLRPPVDMIYSWYWYNRNAVVASLPDSFEEMMKDPFLRNLGCFARHLKPYLDRFPAENFLVIQFEAIRRDPDQVRQKTYSFLNVRADFQPALEQKGKNAARAPRFPLLQSTAQKVYGGISALPGVSTLLKSPVVAKTLQDVYHRLNSKAQKYEGLTADARRKWEEYYAADQAELARQLQNLQVVE